MAYENDPRQETHIHRLGADVTVEQLRWRRISWRGVFGGAVVALAVQTPLILLGLGIGLVNAESLEGMTDVAMATWIWWLVVGIMSIFFGAWVAGHLVAPATTIDGALNGFVTWAVVTLIMLWLATSAATSVAGGAYSVIAGASRSLLDGDSRAAEVIVRSRTGGRQGQQGDPSGDGYISVGEEQGAGGMQSDPLPAVDVDVAWEQIGRDLEELLRSAGIDAEGLNLEQEFEDFGEAPVQNAEQFYAAVKDYVSDSSGSGRERVESYLAANTDLTEQEIQQRIDRWEQEYRQAVENIEQATDQAVEAGGDALGKAAIWSSLSSLAGLLAAGVGGAIGAASASPRRRTSEIPR